MAESTKRMTQFSRTMQYFRTVQLDEANAALTAASGVVFDRERTVQPGKTRKPRTTKTSVVEEGMSANG